MWQELPAAWGQALGRGRIRVQPEDFQVAEVLFIEPCGEGEHCWVHVRKRNSNTQWIARQLARFAEVSPSAVSYAGLKDRRAVAEQWFSIHMPGRADPDWGLFASEEFEVLNAARHRRKLKKGALQGNRFCLQIDAECAVADGIDQRLRQIAAAGFPNYFGPQRFGHNGANLAAAEKMFAHPRARLPRLKRGLYLSTVRSALFNQVLAARVIQGCWNTLMAGDVLQLEGKSACFLAEADDQTIDQRLAALQVHPTGPLCGEGDAMVRERAAQYEAEQLRPYQEWINGLRRFRVAAARRALRVVPSELRWRQGVDGRWQLEFFLPAGSYATSLLREVFDLEEEAQE
jgi:tRNA pseudouridine13 synthase